MLALLPHCGIDPIGVVECGTDADCPSGSKCGPGLTCSANGGSTGGDGGDGNLAGAGEAGDAALPPDSAGADSGGAGAGASSGGAPGAAGESGVTVGGAADLPDDLGPHCVDCTRSAIGSPVWGPVEAVVTTASIGQWSSGTFTGWLTTFFAPNHRYYPEVSVFGPAQPHLPPFTAELEALAAAKRPARILKQTFTTAEFTSPSGVALLLIIAPTPGAAFGRSPDFARGPIISNDLFRLQLDVDIYRDDALYFIDYDSSYPSYTEFDKKIEADGASHVVFGFPANTSMSAAPAAGSYEIRFTVLDSSGQGWDVRVPFRVEP